MKTELDRKDQLTYLAGYMASRKAKVERFGPIVSLAMWVRDGEYGWCQHMLDRYGGGLIWRQKYLVWSLAGQSAIDLLHEVLPIVDHYTPDLGEHIRSVLEGA